MVTQGLVVEADRIFISYRRSDVQFAAGRLGDALSREFGEQRVFRDIEDIDAGTDFAQRLSEALASCKVLLVLIGNAWLHVPGADGRRLDDPRDWVRQEIATALKRGIHVIPVLIEQAQMPAEAQLPDDLKPLARRQAIPLTDARWQSDVNHLIAALRRIDSADAAAAPPAQKVAAQAAVLTKRVGSQVSKWTKRLVLFVMGFLSLLILLPLLMYACSSETPDVAGLWFADSGMPFEFTRADDKGERAYKVGAVQKDFSRLNCTAKPTVLSQIDLRCQVLKGDAVEDRWTCRFLKVSDKPRGIAGDCESVRDGKNFKLVLRPGGK